MNNNATAIREVLLVTVILLLLAAAMKSCKDNSRRSEPKPLILEKRIIG